MKQSTLPSYTKLGGALSKTAQKLHPSQAHGLISGMLCGAKEKQAAWEELVTGGKTTKATHEVLQSVYDESAKQLKEFSFKFQLMLPGDKEDLTRRAEALTLWSQGYLTGLKLVEISIVERQPSEVTEAINDIIEIAKMNYEEVVASEEDEEAYAELVEFVRMAVILVYQNLNGNNTTQAEISSASNQLH